MPPTAANRRVATVFGGSGFLGRYVVNRLAQQGHIVRVAVRDPEGALFLKTMGTVGQIVPLYANLTAEATVQRAIEGAELVVNLVGILAESQPGDFERTHHEGAGRIARLCAAAGVVRLAHVSAIGADPASPSLYASSKGHGEQAVRYACPDAVIFRPSILFGREDNFFNRFASIAQVSPIMPVIAGATRFQPVYVGDVAAAILAGLTRPDAAGALYELGGPKIWTFRELLAYIVAETRRRSRLIPVPPRLAQLQAKVLEKLPGKLLTRDQLLMLQHDNVAHPGLPGLVELGVTPTPVELIVPTYLARYRPGGRQRDLLPGEVKGPKPDLIR